MLFFIINNIKSDTGTYTDDVLDTTIYNGDSTKFEKDIRFHDGIVSKTNARGIGNNNDGYDIVNNDNEKNNKNNNTNESCDNYKEKNIALIPCSNTSDDTTIKCATILDNNNNSYEKWKKEYIVPIPLGENKNNEIDHNTNTNN